MSAVGFSRGQAVTVPAPLGPLISGWVEIRHDGGGDYPSEACYVLTVALTAPGGKPMREERAFGGKIHAQCAAKGAMVRLGMAPGCLTPHNPYRHGNSLGRRAAGNAWGVGYEAASTLLRELERFAPEVRP